MHKNIAKRYFTRNTVFLIVCSIMIGLLCFGTAISCFNSEATPNITTFSKIERVFMHSQNNYSILIQDEITKELRTISPQFGRTQIFADVQDDEFMWARQITYQHPHTHKNIFEIHIHSAKEINGSGWDFGKFGKGTTVPLE